MAQILNNTYEILDFIGKGGMSTVFKAKHVRLNTVVAVKAVRKDQTIDLLAEVNILTKLNHPNLVRVMDIFDDDKLMYIVMDYVEGEDLQHIIQREKVIPEETVMEWFRTLADTMRYLHNRKPPIIYRDMKPANVIRQNDGTLKIIDFGIAREYKASATNDTTYIGTNGFAAPEQFGLAQTDARTDIYSLGMTMFYLATGKSPLAPPYGYTPARKLNPNISEKLEAILEKCIKDNPEDRYQTDDELLYDLNDGNTYQFSTTGQTGSTQHITGPFTQKAGPAVQAGPQKTGETAETVQAGVKPVQQGLKPGMSGKTVGIIAAAAAVAVAGIFLMMPKGGSSGTGSGQVPPAAVDPDTDSGEKTPGGGTETAAPQGASQTDGSGTIHNNANDEVPLVYAAGTLNGCYSPFFASTDGDSTVADLTSLSLITIDRQGAVVEHAASGETRSFNGTDYTYTGPADLDITKNSDGTYEYTFKLREGLFFSEGEPVTADDVIFTMYVLCDPLYNGNSEFSKLDITGLDEYRAGMEPLFSQLYKAGRDNTDYSKWSKDVQDSFWADYDTSADAFVQEILDYLVDNGYNKASDDISVKMKNWAYDVPSDASNGEVFDIMLEAYNGDLFEMTETEHAYSSFADLMPSFYDYYKGVRTGSSADSIRGIRKLDDYTFSITLAGFDPGDVYDMDIPIAPLHYYGDIHKYDPENNMFGFEKGDLSGISSLNDKPFGAGPYEFLESAESTVYLKANEYYYKGEPKIKKLEIIGSSKEYRIPWIIDGIADIADLSFGTDEVTDLQDVNGGSLSGDVLTADIYGAPIYGSLFICADKVNVGGEPVSNESACLRNAFAVIFSVFRESSINSYYGEQAQVIDYPLPAASWASPDITDLAYRKAFSAAADGSDIYTSGMSTVERIEAAKAAALEYFKAAGCTVKDGKVVSAPAGVPVDSSGRIEYEAGVYGSGMGDQPLFMMLMSAKDTLAEINVSLEIVDFGTSMEFWQALESRSPDMFCFAWSLGVDDTANIRSFYFGDVRGNGSDVGISNMSALSSAAIDELILEAERTVDQEARTELYRAVLDAVMGQAVEVPVYQRQNCLISSTERINIDTITPDITAYYSWTEEIENLEFR